MQPLQISALAVENKLQHLCAEQLEPVGSKLKKSTLNTFVFFTLCCSGLHIVTKCFYFFLVPFFFQRKGLLMALFRGPRRVCVIKLLNSFLARTTGVGCCEDTPAQLLSCYQTSKNTTLPNYHIFACSIRGHSIVIHLPLKVGSNDAILYLRFD